MGKVISQSELILQRADWKRNGRRVVLVTGSFDVLHPGHVRLLEQSRSLGEILVVAVDSDEFVRAAHISKGGPARPVTPAAERAEILAALAAVDFVVLSDGLTSRGMLAQLAPEIVVAGDRSGSDARLSRGDDAMKLAGCKLVRIPHEPGYSTTRLIERIIQLRA